MKKIISILLVSILITGCTKDENLEQKPIETPILPMEIKENDMEIELLPQKLIDEINKSIDEYNQRPDEKKYIELKEIDPISKDSKIEIKHIVNDKYLKETVYEVQLNDKYAVNVSLRIEDLTLTYYTLGIVLRNPYDDNQEYKEEAQILSQFELFLGIFERSLMGSFFENDYSIRLNGNEDITKVISLDGNPINTTEDIYNVYYKVFSKDFVEDVLQSAYSGDSITYLLDVDGLAYMYICQCGEYKYQLHPELDRIEAIEYINDEEVVIEVRAQTGYPDELDEFNDKYLETIKLKKEDGLWKIAAVDYLGEFNLKKVNVGIPINN
ncbi:MAG: hypothetical protein RR568_02150 [Anaerorhabdus sp.]|uniref:hypothetical protein n=1 Tax=Anaerorhabdus sp. TaxID=1872524 RepID=UPI002FC96194